MFIPIARGHSSGWRRHKRPADTLQKLRLYAAIVGSGRPTRGEKIACARRLAALQVGIDRARARVCKRYHLNARIAILKVGRESRIEIRGEVVGCVANEPPRGNVIACRANQQAGKR